LVQRLGDATTLVQDKEIALHEARLALARAQKDPSKLPAVKDAVKDADADFKTSQAQLAFANNALVAAAAVYYPELLATGDRDGVVLSNLPIELTARSLNEFSGMKPLPATHNHNIFTATYNRQPCVLKEYNLGTSGLTSQMCREARFLQRLQHSHIIPLQTCFLHHDALYLQLPYYPLGDLEAWLENNWPETSISASILQTFSAQLVDVLVYLSEVGVVHCDIKPDNVLIAAIETGGLKAVLADFDVSKTAHDRLQVAHDAATSARVTRFTADYAPPEVIRASRQRPIKAHSSVDVYSLGAVIYHLHFYPRRLGLSRHAHHDVVQDADVFTIGNDVRSDWAAVENVVDVVKAMCAAGPTERPSAVALLHHPYILGGTSTVRSAMESRPSYWLYTLSDGYKQVHVPELCAKIQELMNSTASPDSHGQGADSHGEKFAAFRVQRVFRVENPTVWTTYAAERRLLANKLTEKKYQRPPFELRTKDFEHPFDASPVGQAAGEVLLFHATAALDSVISNGFDVKYAFAAVANGAMFGRGIYFADSASKSDQYNRATGAGVVHRMLLSRVLLGRSVVVTAARWGDNFMPEVDGESTPAVPVRYDSVVTDPTKIINPRTGLPMRFREIVVGENKQTYPEFVIEYTRG
jgi:serine/threonine protein kinase